MDYFLNIINLDREDYIEWLMVSKGYSKEAAEDMANIMGYDKKGR